VVLIPTPYDALVANVAPKTVTAVGMAFISAMQITRSMFGVLYLNASTIGERVIAKSFAAFGLIALALAGAGLYGVMAFAVAQRTREIGVRRALGAPARHVLGDVFGRSFLELGAGLVIGIVAGVVLARLLTQSLSNIETVGIATIATALGVLVVAVALAISVPVRRALGVDPAVALRHE